MNQRTILRWLREKPGPSSIQLAIDWLKEQPPGDKLAFPVVKAVIQESLFEGVLDWLSKWCATADWKFLVQLVHDLHSPAVFDWLIRLLRANQSNRRSGELWLELLRVFEHPRIEEGASEWLCDYGHGNECAPAVAGELMRCVLRIERGDQVKRIAKEYALKDPRDSSLILQIIESVEDPDVEQLAVKRLTKEDFVMAGLLAAKLLKRGTKYLPQINRLIEKNYFNVMMPTILGELGTSAPMEALPIISKWIGAQVPANSSMMSFGLFSPMLAFHDQPQIKDLVWKWCLSHLDDEESLALILQLQTNHKIERRAIEFLKAWLPDNVHHPQWTSAVNAVMSDMPPKEGLRFGTECLKRLPPEKSERLRLVCLRRSKDAASKKVLKDWLKRNENHHETPLIVANFVKHGDKEITAFARTLVHDLQTTSQIMLLCQLIAVKDPESIDRGKSWLAKRCLPRRFSSRHHNRGLILESLLGVVPDDVDVISASSSWLQEDAGERWTADLKDSIQAAYGKPTE